MAKVWYHFKSFILSAILAFVCFILHSAEIAVPFLCFPHCDGQSNDTASIRSCFIYLLLSPMFVIPIVAFVSLFVSACSSILGVIMHFACGLLNIGNLVYFIMFFNERYRGSYQNKAQQIAPPVMMGLAALGSLICMMDCSRRFIIAKREELENDDGYRPLGGPLQLDGSDSDSD